MLEILVLTLLGQSKEVLPNLQQKVVVLEDHIFPIMVGQVVLVEVVDMMMLVDQPFRVHRVEIVDHLDMDLMVELAMEQEIIILVVVVEQVG